MACGKVFREVVISVRGAYNARPFRLVVIVLMIVAMSVLMVGRRLASERPERARRDQVFGLPGNEGGPLVIIQGDLEGDSDEGSALVVFDRE